jgi:hypothetical protein
MSARATPEERGQSSMESNKSSKESNINNNNNNNNVEVCIARERANSTKEAAHADMQVAPLAYVSGHST